LAILESYRQLLLGIARLFFLVGVLVGFLEPVNFIIGPTNWVLLVSAYTPLFPYLAAMVSSVIWHIAVSIAAAILSWDCYRNLQRGRLEFAGLRGVISGALLIITGMWPAGLFVIIAGITSHTYQAKLHSQA